MLCFDPLATSPPKTSPHCWQLTLALRGSSGFENWPPLHCGSPTNTHRLEAAGRLPLSTPFSMSSAAQGNRDRVQSAVIWTAIAKLNPGSRIAQCCGVHRLEAAGRLPLSTPFSMSSAARATEVRVQRVGQQLQRSMLWCPQVGRCKPVAPEHAVLHVISCSTATSQPLTQHSLGDSQMLTHGFGAAGQDSHFDNPQLNLT